jgi:hypothetical protein
MPLVVAKDNEGMALTDWEETITVWLSLMTMRVAVAWHNPQWRD